jgi:hypothetical protein
MNMVTTALAGGTMVRHAVRFLIVLLPYLAESTSILARIVLSRNSAFRADTIDRLRKE